MGRLILFVVLVGVVVWMLTTRSRRPPGSPRAGRRPPAEPTAMRECAHCGLHLPQAEALSDDQGRPYCSEAHRRAGPR